MKYCRVCKIRAKETDTVCAKCGGPVATLGARPAPGSAAPGAPALGLQGQIQALQQVERQTTRRMRMVALVCALVLLGILGTLYTIYHRTVLSYAVLQNVRIEQDPLAENLVRVSFDVLTPGKVAFDRRSGRNRTEKLDVLTRKGPIQLAWAWPSDVSTGIDFDVVYRQGLTRTNARQHFALTGKRGGALDLVFLMDTTGSMSPFIQGLQRKCIEFAEVVRREGYDCQLGLIGFGDVSFNESITAFDMTGDVLLFQSHVAQIPRTHGGDPPESSVEALQRALQMSFRPEAKVCFVHITDAECHQPRQLTGITEELERRGIVTYVVSRSEYQNLYSPLCVQGGRFYAIQEARFEDILLNVARSITNQIRYR